MKLPFRRERGGDDVLLELPEHERALLIDLTRQVVQLLEHGDADDAAVARLLPSAYPDDAEAASEFRRFTADDLTNRKIANARVVLATLADRPLEPSGDDTGPTTADTEPRRRGSRPRGPRPDERRLDTAAQQAWLRSLTDLRLTLGTRLGVTDEGMPDDAEPHLRAMLAVFDWLGYLQESLLQTLTRR
ncbi:DUF2017 family protein [Frigoribacterium sp. CFBP 13712]|uniref:DUF2017 family protein n=1 Tax=Frigoribacterium sp. CFBP 13712 TaxID=2775309 RepID=UPI00352CB6F6